MSNHHTCQKCHICCIWHIWHLAFDMHMYFNMGGKRSVRTSGMQPTMLDILNNCFQGQKWNILFPKKFFVYFRISFVYFKWLGPARFSLKLLSLLDKSHLIGPNNHRKGGNNLFMTLCKFWDTLIKQPQYVYFRVFARLKAMLSSEVTISIIKNSPQVL